MDIEQMFLKGVGGMKITKIVRFEEAKSKELESLNQLMAVFCSALHFFFNRLVEGEEEKKLIKKIHVIFHLNKRYAEDAVMQAQAVIASQKKLLPIRIEGVQAKMQRTEQKIEDYQTGKKTPKKVPLEICLKGLSDRLEKLREKESVFLKHQESETIPTVIFGGKKNFYERMKRENFKRRMERTYGRILCILVVIKSKKGNLNTRIVFDDKGSTLLSGSG